MGVQAKGFIQVNKQVKTFLRIQGNKLYPLELSRHEGILSKLL